MAFRPSAPEPFSAPGLGGRHMELSDRQQGSPNETENCTEGEGGAAPPSVSGFFARSYPPPFHVLF